MNIPPPRGVTLIRTATRRRLRPAVAIACAGMLSLFTGFAAELKVDINNTGRPLTEGLDPAYTPWSTNQNWYAGEQGTTNTFDTVTVAFTCVGGGTNLQPNYWKAGVQSTVYNIKLTADGIKVNNGDAGAQIEMRISGLTGGAHTLLLYHSVWDGLTNTDVAPLDLFVNGSQVINNLPMSIRVTNNVQAATAYLNLNVTAGQDVVVLIKAETSGTQTTKNVYINAFEIDTPDSKKQANTPVPANANEHVNADTHTTTLSWAPATLGALSHDVYFGTSSNNVYNGTHASAEFKGNQTSLNFPVTGLSSLAMYFWRIDELTATNTTKGALWYFRSRHVAFPGAEGYGQWARGGRGGKVVEVSNLNDSGPGSLRQALENNIGPRIVVFSVGGLITLNSNLTISQPYITVAGQTAPGKGICTRAWPFGMSGAKDNIMRDIRSRPGNISSNTINGSGMAGVDNTIMDHVSISWGIDEELSTRGAYNVTFQKSFISEALNIAGHQNYPPGTAHGYAASIGGNIGSFHHNLLAHNEGRNWSLAGGLDASGFFAGLMDIFDNVVYNWGSRATDGGAHEVNFVNNYYKPGAATSFFFALNAQYDAFPGTQQYYFAGNVMPGHFTLGTETSGREATDGTGTPPTNYSPWVSAPFFVSNASMQTATNAYKYVLSDVGCNQPQLDDHDKRVIMETFTGTFTYTGTGPFGGLPGLPNSQDDVGGWENYPTTNRPANFDTDHDGLPDWWERLKGLNTNSAAGDFSDANADLVGDEYTEIDRYINWMADPHLMTTLNTAVDLNLTNLTAGFAASSTYTVSGAVNGAISLTGGKTAHFVPTTGFTGFGSYNFVVSDGQTSMTNTIGVAVLGGAAPPPPPAAPTALSATAGNALVTLTWVQSTGGGITQNKVYRSTNGSGGPYNLLVTLSATTSYTNTGLINGNTYFYSVTAVNTNGESSMSAFSGATPTAGGSVPAAPTGLAAIAGNTKVALGWTASSGATSYRVKRATVNGGPYSNIATNTITTYTNTGLANGTTYYFVVSAVNATGESANSSQASATPSAGSVTNVIQAEAGTIGGGTTIDSNNAGFNGTGFANFPVTGGFLTFSNVSGGAGGASTLAIRYALGTTNRTGQMVINSATQNLTFVSTTTFTNWVTLSTNVTLTAGSANTIRFQSNGHDLGNIDQISVITH